MAFKITAAVFYVFYGLFSDNTTFCYIVVISVCALDFWTVKNVSGRILVGLRWWSIIKEDGKEEWKFESLDLVNKNKADNRVFWVC